MCRGDVAPAPLLPRHGGARVLHRSSRVARPAQPSLSEQIRILERGLSATLFHRVGRGVVPTEAARALEPHARQALDAVDQGSRAVTSVGDAVTGTIRFGLFGAAHLYLPDRLVADLRERFPHARLALIGQNSTDTIDRVRRGISRQHSSPSPSRTTRCGCTRSSVTRLSTSVPTPIA
ncbi:LysR family transcriptional regulator [Pseudonocardia halophobica]|uniref:LysR family transcriptional regulator n=1 Tax=Pseudonocardia halophobica TaxID=29401 RepID=UPI003D8BF2E6